MRNKFKGKKLDYVIDKMEGDKKLSITDASKLMCKKFNLSYKDGIRRSISKLLARKKITSNTKIESSNDFLKAKSKKLDKGKKTLIIGWAQNATPTHKGLFENILALKDNLNAGLHIVAGRYRNPTSVHTDKDHDWWDKSVVPYLDANRHNVHKFLQVLSDVKVSPTASTPLSGLNGITGIESCVIGHPRQHLKSLPVLDGYPNKLLLSTGACTIENYTDSKAGKKGEFHHSLGFIIVELDGDNFHIRQVSADENGNFYDLFKRVKNGVVKKNKKGCEAAILGDIHLQHNDLKATSATFKLLDKMKPKHTLIHDIIDCESISHHDLKDPFRLLKKEDEGTDDLAQELSDMIKWLNDKEKYNLVIVRSNHDDFLDRWLKNSDWRKVGNKKMYLEGANILANEKVAQEKGVIPYLIEEAFGDKIITLGLDDSYRVLGWELGIHGHVGASGARGSHITFKNMNTKNVTGHVHHPHREDGHMSVGTLTKLKLSYNKGLSNWMHSNVLIYPDGKAQHIHIINGKYHR